MYHIVDLYVSYGWIICIIWHIDVDLKWVFLLIFVTSFDLHKLLDLFFFFNTIICGVILFTQVVRLHLLNSDTNQPTSQFLLFLTYQIILKYEYIKLTISISYLNPKFN